MAIDQVVTNIVALIIFALALSSMVKKIEEDRKERMKWYQEQKRRNILRK